MATIDIIIRGNNGEICGRQIQADLADVNIKYVAESIAHATKETIPDIVRLATKMSKLEDILNLEL